MSALVSRGAVPRHGADAVFTDAPARLARYRTFHTLDALRGVAAVAVLLFHAAFIYGIAPPAEGQIAVDLFFVMSGFIIAYRYEDDLRSGMGLAGFLKVRLIRLYPLFLLGAVLGVVPALVAVATGHADGFYKGLLGSFPLAILMLPSRYALPRVTELYPLNYVAWSLALEIVINIAYAATFRVWTTRRLILLVGVAFVGLCGCVACYGTLNVGFAWPHAPGGLARILYGFGMGVLIHRLYRSKPLSPRVPWWALLALALGVFFFDPPLAKPLWELFAVTIVVPFIVVAAIVNEPPKLARGACATAGIFSYVVYSLHAPFVGFFLRGEDRLHLDLHAQSPGKAFVFTVLFLALCVAAHLAYDKPIRRFLSRRRAVSLGGSLPERPANAGAAVKN